MPPKEVIWNVCGMRVKRPVVVGLMLGGLLSAITTPSASNTWMQMGVRKLLFCVTRCFLNFSREAISTITTIIDAKKLFYFIFLRDFLIEFVALNPAVRRIAQQFACVKLW
jgi:hypothetical protein